jgi:hypothetical protein
LTTRTEQAAAQRRHPGAWTYDDLALARLEANATSRPHGISGPSPDELWSARTGITPAERAAFAQTVAWLGKRLEPDEAAWSVGTEAALAERALNRKAISRALVEHGYLHYTRRPTSPPIRKQKAARIM